MAEAKPAAPGHPTSAQTLLAWLVHMFTASGAILALLALLAVEDGNWTLALIWLLVALVVDGVDGSLARWAKVKDRAPQVDGDTLDLVIDYLTYVFVPTLFMWRAGLFPEDLALWLAGGIQLSSLYLFARTDMKTQDGYFRGFPALWNLVAFYLYVLQPGPAVGSVVVVLLIAMTFAPVHFVHPFRVRAYGAWLPLLAGLWAASTGALLWRDSLPAMAPILIPISVVSASLLFLLGLARSWASLRGASGISGPPGNHRSIPPFGTQHPPGVATAMKILLYVVGFFALIGFLLVAGCFKLVF